MCGIDRSTTGHDINQVIHFKRIYKPKNKHRFYRWPQKWYRDFKELLYTAGTINRCTFV